MPAERPISAASSECQRSLGRGLGAAEAVPLRSPRPPRQTLAAVAGAPAACEVRAAASDGQQAWPQGQSPWLRECPDERFWPGRLNRVGWRPGRYRRSPGRGHLQTPGRMRAELPCHAGADRVAVPRERPIAGVRRARLRPAPAAGTSRSVPLGAARRRPPGAPRSCALVGACPTRRPTGQVAQLDADGLGLSSQDLLDGFAIRPERVGDPPGVVPHNHEGTESPHRAAGMYVRSHQGLSRHSPAAGRHRAARSVAG